MAKDPAFLFYPGDWLGGTITFSRLHKGAYMDLLMVQFNQGHMSLQDIQIVLGNDFSQVWEKLRGKFAIDKNGLYYNERLENEQKKRKKYTDSRKDNLISKKKHTSHMDTHMDSHMENENEDENINKDINKELIKVWISTFGRNPNLMEQEETEKHFKEFGIDKTKRIYKEAYKKGFRNVFKLTEQLNPDGSIKPKDGETPKPHYNRNPLAGIGQ